MTANNMDELNTMLIKQLGKAMNVTSDKVLADMYEETGKFYTKGKPVMYERTGALGNTPGITSLSFSSLENGGEVSFDAYLDTNYQYTSGDKPNMQQVLELANYGTPWTTASGAAAKPTLGKKGFWERAEKKIEKSLNKTLKKFFK